MKRIKSIVIMGCLLCGSASLFAQATIYEADRMMSRDLNGTARFVGMGGAMGALGGDISVMGTNPAGIGIYRSGDIMLSFGFNSLNSHSNLSGSKLDTDKFSGSFDNIGFVYSHKVGDLSSLRFVNFGFNYNRVKSFNRNFVMQGDFNGNSQIDLMWGLADERGATGSMLGDRNSLSNSANLPWLSVMGWETGLLDDVDGELGQIAFANPDGYYHSREKGGLHSYDFNVSFNFLDAVYVGATLGAYSIDYNRSSYYEEGDYDSTTWYSLENWMETTGSGVDFKLGVIVRPTDSFRFGVAVHTPTYFNLRDRSSARMNSYNVNIDNVERNYSFDTYDDAGDLITDYKIITPWKFNFSLGTTIGRVAAIGAEYEYSDHSSAKLKYDDGVHMTAENNMAKEWLKGVHTFRIGGEVKVLPEISLRAGYNFISDAVSKDAVKELPSNSARTDAEYFNQGKINNYTLGLGYRGHSPFYADVAYQYSHARSDFYAFDDFFGRYAGDYLPATKVTNNRHQLLLTLGMRF